MELFRALAVLAEPPTEEAARVADALGLGPAPDSSAYTELFIFQLYPYASVYLGAEGMIGGEARELVAGFWRALGQKPVAEADHLSVMLALYARLAELEEDESDAQRREGWRVARKAFLWEHLLSWLPAYLSKVSDIAPQFYKSWSEILLDALFAEAVTVGKQEQLSLHLREDYGLIDPRAASAGDFLQSLLAPARSGMILVRSDLSRATETLKLGLRLGERKFVLKSMLGQDAEGTLAWLAREAEVWANRHRLSREFLGETARVWENRAHASATLLRELKQAAQKVSAS
jgi:TorA maturation chaperone TorD